MQIGKILREIECWPIELPLRKPVREPEPAPARSTVPMAPATEHWGTPSL